MKSMHKILPSASTATLRIDQQQAQRVNVEQQEDPIKLPKQYQRYENTQIPVIPSVRCNASGAKLAHYLIGAATYLQAIGQHFNGDPGRLTEDYPNGCTRYSDSTLATFRVEVRY